MPQCKQLLLGGHPGAEACLAGCPETLILCPADDPLLQNGCIQPAKGFPHSNWAVVARVRPIALFEDWGDKGRLHGRGQHASLESRIKDRRQV